jgi:hypothetical protein
VICYPDISYTPEVTSIDWAPMLKITIALQQEGHECLYLFIIAMEEKK